MERRTPSSACCRLEAGALKGAASAAPSNPSLDGTALGWRSASALRSDSRSGRARLQSCRAFGWRSASALRSEFEVGKGTTSVVPLSKAKMRASAPEGRCPEIPPHAPAQPWKSGASAPRKLRLKEPAFPSSTTNGGCPTSRLLCEKWDSTTDRKADWAGAITPSLSS